MTLSPARDQHTTHPLPQAAFTTVGNLLEGDPDREHAQRLPGPAVLPFDPGPLREMAAAWLEGLVRCIQAALAPTEAARYAAEAARAYDRVFRALHDPGLGAAIVADVVGRLRQAADPVPAVVRTPVLLDPSAGVFALLAVAAGPGAARLLPDPIGLGLTVLEDSFLEAFAAAWAYTRPQPYFRPDRCLRWGWAHLRGVTVIRGASGGAAVALAARATLEEVALDHTVAISARILPGGGLGAVGSAASKCAAARQAGCDQALFVPGEELTRVPTDERHARPIPVTTLAEAWELMSGRRQALEAHRAAEQALIWTQVRFRPEGSGADPAALLRRLHVPMQVLTRVEVSWDEAAAEREEAERQRRGDTRRRQRDEAGEPHLPPTPSERFGDRRREEIRAFDEVFASLRDGRGKVVVLGDPGYGKSWLTWQVSLRGLEEYLNGSGHWLPLRLTCQELGGALRSQPPLEPDLPKAAAATVAGRLKQWNSAHAHRADQLQQAVVAAFQAGRVLLLLDGWDERDADHDRPLRAALDAWHGPLLVTSRVVGYSRNVLPADCPRWQLMALEAPAGAETLVRNWFGGGDRAPALLDALRLRPQLLQLVRVPLIAALVCWLWQRGKLPPLPEQRTRLLEACLRELIVQGCRDRGAGPRVQSEPAAEVVEEVTLALAKLAYETFRGERWLIGRLDLQRGLSRLPAEIEGLGTGSDLRKALTGRFGLFTEAADGRLEILHQSLAEYLCAAGAVEACRHEKQPLGDWLAGHGGLRLLDPRWHEVWCHLAGLLEDATPLVRHLWQLHQRPGRGGPRPRLGEDVFDSALCLAGHCLAAAQSRAYQAGDARPLWDTDPGREVLVCLVAGIDSGRIPEPLREEFREALIALGRSGCAQRLSALLGHKKSEVRGDIATILGRVGAAAAVAVPDLLPLLRAEDGGVRLAAALALGQVGAAAAVPHLLPLLRAEDGGVRLAAAEALGRVGLAAVPHLLPLLRAEDGDMRYAAARALGQVGAAAAVPHLLPLLRAEDGDMRYAAARALGQVGAAAAVPHLLPLLRDEVRGVRQAAAAALGRVGAAAAAAVPHLLPLLRDEDGFVRWAAAAALGRVGAAAAAVPHLLPLLRDEAGFVRWAAAAALLSLANTCQCVIFGDGSHWPLGRTPLAVAWDESDRLK